MLATAASCCAVSLLFVWPAYAAQGERAAVDTGMDAATDAALNLADQADRATSADQKAAQQATRKAAASHTAKAVDVHGPADVPPSLPEPVAVGAAPEVSRGQDLALSAQNAVRYADLHTGGDAWQNQVSLDLRYEKTLAAQFDVHASWRLDRFDALTTDAQPGHTETLLREAYGSWRPGALTTLEAGRMNQRVGVAFGYNPTDFFRAGAVDLDVSPDPMSRRTNRLGTVGVRAQQLWDSGSVALLYSPRLASRMEPGDPDASGQLQRTNSVGRWMAVASQRVSSSLQPQFVAYGEEGQEPQFGMNLSALFGNAVVGYMEVAAGRRPSLINQMMGGPNDTAFRLSSASGLTWTLPMNLSLSLELQTNAAGAAPAQWRTLMVTNPMAWGRAVQGAVDRQELPTRYGGFALAIWRNVLVRRLDLSAFAQLDQGGGAQTWLELRRHFDRFDVAMQWQSQFGHSWGRYGAMQERHSVQVLGTFYR